MKTLKLGRKTKVAIISNYERAYAPYIEFYADLCKNNDVEYIVINKEESCSKKDDQVAFVLNEDTMKFGSIRRTLQWYRFVLSKIKKHHCNKFVVLPTRTAIVLFPFLLFLKNKFIFDIRDYTKEHNKIYKKLEDILIKKSYMTTISSPGFREWLLPSEKIHHIHNMPYEEVTGKNAKDIKTEQVVIGFLGCMYKNYQEYNENMLKKLRENPKYKFIYYGYIPTEFIEFCSREMIQNAIFEGKYRNEEKAKLYKRVDIINAVYGGDSVTVLPNRLYDALLYKKPIIAMKGTFLASLVEKYKIGIAIDVEKENLAEKIEVFLSAYTPEEHSKNCERMLQEIKKEQGETIN